MRSLREALDARNSFVFLSPDAATFKHPLEGTL